MKFNTKNQKGQWFDYVYEGQTLKLFIKPYSMFAVNSTPSGQQEDFLSRENLLKLINYCLDNWENIFDQDGNPLECNKENKLMVCESIVDIFSFVIERSHELRKGILIQEEEIKN